MKLIGVIGTALVVAAVVIVVHDARQSWRDADRQRQKDKIFAEVIIPFLSHAFPGTYRYDSSRYFDAVAIEGSHGDFTVVVRGQDAAPPTSS